MAPKHPKQPSRRPITGTPRTPRRFSIGHHFQKTKSEESVAKGAAFSSTPTLHLFKASQHSKKTTTPAANSRRQNKKALFPFASHRHLSSSLKHADIEEDDEEEDEDERSEPVSPLTNSPPPSSRQSRVNRSSQETHSTSRSPSRYGKNRRRLLQPSGDSKNSVLTAEDEMASWRTTASLDSKSAFDLLQQTPQPKDLSGGWKVCLRPDLPLESLAMIGDIGTGHFGSIKLVTIEGHHDEQDAPQFALKVLDRSRITNKKEQTKVMNERLVMQALNHPFHLRLINTYKTPTELYILADYMPGGDLFEHIHRLKYHNGRMVQPIPAEDQKFYVANILLALEHMHRRGVIHRDIKTANLLISRSGYIKVCDYGLARFLQLGEQANTLVGTYQYLAPEQCRMKPYDHSVDLWALGIVVYEMNFGLFPFNSNARDSSSEYSKSIVNQVLTKNVQFPFEPEIGLTSKLFIKSLLTKNKATRLGGDLDYPKVMNSAWLRKGVNWDKIRNQEVSAPWIPGRDRY